MIIIIFIILTKDKASQNQAKSMLVQFFT